MPRTCRHLDVSHHVQQEKQGKTVGSNEYRVCNANVLLTCFRTVITYQCAVHDQLCSQLQIAVESSLCPLDVVKALCKTFGFQSGGILVSQSEGILVSRSGSSFGDVLACLIKTSACHGLQ